MLKKRYFIKYLCVEFLLFKKDCIDFIYKEPFRHVGYKRQNNRRPK